MIFSPKSNTTDSTFSTSGQLTTIIRCPGWFAYGNSDDQQFYQYYQNEQPPFTLSHLAQKQPRHLTLEIQVLA